MSWSPKTEAWQELKNTVPYIQKGKIHTVQEQVYISKGPQVKIGDTVMVGENKVLCEVISIEKENNMLLPFNQSDKVAYGDWVYVTDTKITIPADEFLLGKVLNASGDILNEEAGMAKFKQKCRLKLHQFMLLAEQKSLIRSKQASKQLTGC